MIWCVREAIREEDEAFLTASVCTTLFRDERNARLALRFAAIDENLNIRPRGVAPHQFWQPATYFKSLSLFSLCGLLPPCGQGHWVAPCGSGEVEGRLKSVRVPDSGWCCKQAKAWPAGSMQEFRHWSNGNHQGDQSCDGEGGD